MVNKQGQTRISKYYNSFSVQEKLMLEGELIRKCLSRIEGQVLIFMTIYYFSVHS
jgi:AP-4 complex subunit sigma-1